MKIFLESRAPAIAEGSLNSAFKYPVNYTWLWILEEAARSPFKQIYDLSLEAGWGVPELKTYLFGKKISDILV